MSQQAQVSVPIVISLRVVSWQSQQSVPFQIKPMTLWSWLLKLVREAGLSQQAQVRVPTVISLWEGSWHSQQSVSFQTEPMTVWSWLLKLAKPARVSGERGLSQQAQVSVPTVISLREGWGHSQQSVPFQIVALTVWSWLLSFGGVNVMGTLGWV